MEWFYTECRSIANSRQVRPRQPLELLRPPGTLCWPWSFSGEHQWWTVPRGFRMEWMWRSVNYQTGPSPPGYRRVWWLSSLNKHKFQIITLFAIAVHWPDTCICPYIWFHFRHKYDRMIFKHSPFARLGLRQVGSCVYYFTFYSNLIISRPLLGLNCRKCSKLISLLPYFDLKLSNVWYSCIPLTSLKLLLCWAALLQNLAIFPFNFASSVEETRFFSSATNFSGVPVGTGELWKSILQNS